VAKAVKEAQSPEALRAGVAVIIREELKASAMPEALIETLLALYTGKASLMDAYAAMQRGGMT